MDGCATVTFRADEAMVTALHTAKDEGTDPNARPGPAAVFDKGASRCCASNGIGLRSFLACKRRVGKASVESARVFGKVDKVTAANLIVHENEAAAFDFELAENNVTCDDAGVASDDEVALNVYAVHGNIVALDLKVAANGDVAKSRSVAVEHYIALDDGGVCSVSNH